MTSCPKLSDEWTKIRVVLTRGCIGSSALKISEVVPCGEGEDIKTNGRDYGRKWM